MHRRFAVQGLALALMASTSAHAEVTTEHKLWIDATVRAELMDALDVSVTQHLRTADGARRVGQVMPELELSYGFLDHFAVGAGVRYAFEQNEDDETARTVRFHGQLGVESPDLGPVELGYRLRLQRETAPDDEAKTRLRNKAALQVDTDSSLKPGVFYEHFLDPGGDAGHKSQKYRLGAGVTFKINATHRLKLKLFQDKEIDGDGDKQRVVSLGYRYSF